MLETFQHMSSRHQCGDVQHKLSIILNLSIISNQSKFDRSLCCTKLLINKAVSFISTNLPELNVGNNIGVSSWHARSCRKDLEDGDTRMTYAAHGVQSSNKTPIEITVT